MTSKLKSMYAISNLHPKILITDIPESDERAVPTI